MRRESDKYTQFGLVRDMLAATAIVERFDTQQALDTARAIAGVGRLLLTGEGSSRVFPAKNAIAHARRRGWNLQLHTEAGRQAQEYGLADWAVFALSNSGRTREVIELFTKLRDAGHPHLYSLTAFANSKLESLATRGYVLSCGEEGAVAATKSVIEQALFYRALLEAALPYLAGETDTPPWPPRAWLEPELAALAARQSWLHGDIPVHLDEVASGGHDGDAFEAEYRAMKYPTP